MQRSPERIQFLSDIMVTGIETGWPWFEWERYQSYEANPRYRERPDDPITVHLGERHGDEACALAYELNDDETGYKYDTPLEITLDDVARGLKLWIESLPDTPSDRYQPNVRAYMRRAEREHDAGEFDAADCDSILQLAALGENRYA